MNPQVGFSDIQILHSLNLQVLKKICDHPLLLTERAASEIARGAARAGQHAVADGRADLSVDELTEGDAAAAAEMALAIARARGISIGEGSAAKETSCKVLFLMELLEDLVWNGHRTLVFSQSKKMLDIIQVGCEACLGFGIYEEVSPWLIV
jgi:SNF2 family DNA or RNA helicase